VQLPQPVTTACVSAVHSMDRYTDTTTVSQRHIADRDVDKLPLLINVTVRQGECGGTKDGQTVTPFISLFTRTTWVIWHQKG